jgi:hypothetical protein
MSSRDFLRHTVATLAYRGGKALRGAPEGFAAFRAREKTRTPVEILAHIGDLLDWALELAQGRHTWKAAPAGPWETEAARFFDGLGRLEALLASGAPLGCSEEKLFQGPVADALTHIGQIAMLRRLSGAPIKAENYFKADIAVGRVGPEQPAPRLEFE